MKRPSTVIIRVSIFSVFFRYTEVLHSTNLIFAHSDRVCRTINAKRFPRSNHPGNVVQIYYCDVTDAAAYEESMMPLRKATARNRPLVRSTNWECFVSEDVLF